MSASFPSVLRAPARAARIGLVATALCAISTAQEAAERAPRTRPHVQLPDLEREPVPRTGERTPAPRSTTPDRAARGQAPTPNPPTFDVLESSPASWEGRWSRVDHSVDRAGALWVRGRDFKASADPEGFAFIPFLGSDAPRNFPVRFRLSGVARGSAPLELAPSAEVDRDGDRIVLDRGSVEVRYDVSPESVEQSFALQVPPGSGHLTLSLTVESELSAASRGAGLRFSNDRGGMDYGAAVVFDAVGLRADVTARWTGTGIDLVVPSAFLAEAVGPIVVDPVLSTFAIDTYQADLRSPDAAYDLSGDRYIVVYEEQFSGGDRDVYSTWIDATTGTFIGSGYIESGAEDWTRPAVAILRGPEKVLVAAQAPSVIQAGSTDIVGRYGDAVAAAFDPPTILKGATVGYGCVTPDLGGESVNTTVSNFCLVYARQYSADRDVAAIIIDPAGSYVGGEITLGGFVSRDEGQPTVSKSTGDGGGATLFCVAWSVQDLNTFEERVDACQLTYDGSAVIGPFEVIPDSLSNSYFDIEVSELSNLRHPVTGDQYWVVSYDDSPSSFTDAFVALCSGEIVHSVAELQVIEHANRISNEEDVTIATTGRTFQLGYRSGQDLMVTILQPIGDFLGVTERRLFVEDADYQDGGLAAASRFSGGSALQDSLFCASAFESSTSSYDVLGARIESAFGVAASGYQYCYGEANSSGEFGFLQALGDRSRFNPQTLVATGLPPNTFGLLVASLTNGVTPNPLGEGNLCVAGAIGRYPVFQADLLGTATLIVDPTAIYQPSAIVAAGVETWHFQAWHRDVVSGSQSSNFTNGVAIPFE